MTQSDCLVLQTVRDNTEIFDAIVRAMEEQANQKMPLLRQLARNGDTLKAAQAEAEMRALESVPQILKTYAAEYRRS